MNGFSNLFLREPSFIKKANGMIVGVGEILEHERGINLTESRMNHIVFSSKPGKLFYDESGVCDELYFEDSIGTLPCPCRWQPLKQTLRYQYE